MNNNYFSLLNASSLDPSQVTILEIYSSDELTNLIKSSLRYILNYYATRYPRYLLKIALKFDLFYILLMTPIEYHFQNKYNSSFTQHFYGIKKVSISPLLSTHLNYTANKTQQPLSKKQIYASIANSLLLPYIKDLIDNRFESLKARNQEPVKLIDKAILKLWPYLRLSISTANVVLSVLYLFQNTLFHCISDWILGIRYARLSENDQTTNSLSSSSILSALMFILRLADWYPTSNLSHQLARKHPTSVYISKDIPPIEVKNNSNSFPVPYQPSSPLNSAGSCSLCNSNPPNNPTAIDTGYVFCYPCIHKFLSSTNPPYCPVSRQKLWKCQQDDNNEWNITPCLLRLMI